MPPLQTGRRGDVLPAKPPPKHQPAPQKESTNREHQSSHRSNLRCSAGPKPRLPAHIEEALKPRGRGHLPVPISTLGTRCLSFGQDARTTHKIPTPPGATQPSHPLPPHPMRIIQQGRGWGSSGAGRGAPHPLTPHQPPYFHPGPTQDTRHDGTALRAPPRAPQSAPAPRLPSTGDVFSLLQTLCTPP